MNIYRSIKILLLLVIFNSYSQELPPIKTFLIKDYGAENQNWDISQSENKFIYVANNKGLLEFNGANWQLYNTPNKTIIRSVKAYQDRIYTGFYMDFGYWLRNDFGALEYTSIAKENNINLIEDEQIWDIIELDGWIVFKSLQRIYLYNLNSKSIKIINSENRIEKTTKLDGVLYFQEINKGIFKIENGISKLVTDNTILKSNILIDIYKKDGKLLFLTQKNGFYYFEGNKIKQWEIPANKKILNKKLYSGIRLKNNDFLLGTISNGLYYINNNGVFEYEINQSSGLSNNTILSIIEDVDNNIWLGLDNGINYINLSSPFKTYKDKTNFWGTIYTSALHNGYLYLGTNQGVFFKKYNSNESFKYIEKTQGQAWSLKEIDNELFCGHDSGTFIINNGIASSISNIQGTWDIKKINKNMLLQGNYSGLYVLEKVNNKWRLKNKIKGFDNSSRYFEIINKNTIIVNHEYKNIFKLTIDSNYKHVKKIEKDTSVEKGIHSSIIKYHDDIFYAHENGVFKLNRSESVFKLDTLYSKLISKEGFTSGKLIYNKKENKLWSFSKDNISYLSPGKLSNKPIINKISISETIRKGASGYENIIHLENQRYLLGTSDGYITINLENQLDINNFKISINKGISFVKDKDKKAINLNKKNIFESNVNNFEFSFGVPVYNKMITTNYQYQLEGHNKQWSLPTSSNSILFENISYGEYKFKVRGIIAGKISDNEATFKFEIKKPWYLSNSMLSVYICAFLLLLYILHLSSKKYYKNQREKLLEKAQKESELKELESSKEIMKLNNEKLRNDIESKNRELATSTMNMIKKNEFLSSLKKELINDGEKNLNKVIKIIDKNLNNTDDWKMFQEAFNNADKNFLKKIKDKHPELTPNDLRLCAYLRLNLSSKEIAPLLNISHRSVEVKRYRLRKKMSLSHNLNLTNYILEI